jgi:hypothetical protein
MPKFIQISAVKAKDVHGNLDIDVFGLCDNGSVLWIDPHADDGWVRLPDPDWNKLRGDANSERAPVTKPATAESIADNRGTDWQDWRLSGFANKPS